MAHMVCSCVGGADTHCRRFSNQNESRMPPRDKIDEHILFSEDIRKVLREFDAYARSEPAKGAEATVEKFHALRGEALEFSHKSLQAWLSIRRRHGKRSSFWTSSA